MILKKKEFFLLIFLILLQSCSGGRIGNFLESSFNDLEKISVDDDKQKNLEKKNVILEKKKETNDKNHEKRKEIEEPIYVLEKKEDQILEKIQKQENGKIKDFSEDRKKEFPSYKIIFILKDVDPKYFTEELNTILSNSGVNYEIEKIERILDSGSKSIKKN